MIRRFLLWALNRLTPLQCRYCKEPVRKGEPHMPLPALSRGRVRMMLLHRECFLRSVFGSIGHQRGTCPCHGGSEDDPPGMTAREAAKAAVLYFETHKPKGARA